ncbi:MAG: alpha/beta hydrolase [Dehalococcoidia bacterium]
MPAASRPLTIPNGDLSLEAMLHLPSDAEPGGLLVVCHPHPQHGGAMENNVVYALCEAALQEGLAALRFNFRGVGRSTGQYDGGNGERDDLVAVLSAATGMQTADRLGLAGYSFGALMAVAGCRGPVRVNALVLVSLPLQMTAGIDFDGCPAGRLLLTGDNDPICPSAQLEALAGSLQPSPDCQIVEGADHSWVGYEAELRDIVAGYLRWQLLAT